MTIIKVSVIIPVYNSERYLEQCLNSVINQTLKEIEIICIDDGSTDGSSEILERYRNQDSRIKVLTQANSGPAAARNNGLNNAAGEYIAFLDSDDFYMPEALEMLYTKAVMDDTDICVFGAKYYYDYYGDIVQFDALPKKKWYPERMPFCISENYDYILNFTTHAVWKKLYKKDFITKHKLQFPNIKRAEDLPFSQLSLCLAERITVLREPLISYRFLRQDSLTSTIYEKPKEIIEAWFISAEKLKEHNVYPEQSFLNSILSSMVCMFRSLRLSWTVFESVYDQLKNGDLQKLGLIPREPGYYYVPWHEEILNNLFLLDAHDFLVSFISIMEIRNRKLTASKDAQKQKYQEKQDKNAQLISQQKAEIKELEKENKRIKRENDKLISSASYKIGRMITWLPRMIKKLFNSKH